MFKEKYFNSTTSMGMVFGLTICQAKHKIIALVELTNFYFDDDKKPLSTLYENILGESTVSTCK